MQGLFRVVDRINQFVSKMITSPSPIGSYLPPIVAASHASDPSKFKGKASVICHWYMPEKERIPLTIDSYKFLSSPLNGPKPLRRSGSYLGQIHTPSKVSQQGQPSTTPKTYFTGVTSAVFGPARRGPSRGLQRNQSQSVNNLARRVLVESKVFREQSEFLKKGQGKLACSPSQGPSEVHSSISQSQF